MIFLAVVCGLSILIAVVVEKSLLNLYSSKSIGKSINSIKIRPMGFFHSFFKELAYYKTGSLSKSLFMPMLHFGVSLLPLAVLTFCEPLVYNRAILKSEIFSDTNSVFMFLALVEVSVVTHILIGWSVNNNLAILGNLKKIMQFFSIELLFLIITLIMTVTYQSADFHQINNIQNKVLFGKLDLNGIYLQPIVALAYFYYITVKALYLKNIFNFELSGTRFNLGFYMNSVTLYMTSISERINLFCHSILFCHLFLGGYDVIPGSEFLIENFPNSLYFVQIGSLMTKSMIILALSSSVKWLIPKLRTDQLLNKAWKFWTPVLLLNALGTYVFKLLKEIGWV